MRGVLAGWLRRAADLVDPKPLTLTPSATPEVELALLR
jgi:hypothetical protein